MSPAVARPIASSAVAPSLRGYGPKSPNLPLTIDAQWGSK